jgi:hypothetical protein
MPHALKPNTCNSCSKVNLTKARFRDGGHCFATLPAYPTRAMLWHSEPSNLLIIPPLHGHGVSQDASIHFSMILTLRTSFKSWKPPMFGLLCHQTMHLL